MNYEEKYKKAVQQIRDLLERSKENGWLQMLAFEKDFEQIFPELQESEDERIRKWCISHFKAAIRVTKDNAEYQEYLNNKVIPWLEKQKPSDVALEYLRKTHSPSEVSDFQAAMNIAVAKAYDKGMEDGLEKQGGKNLSWSEDDEKNLQGIICEIQANKNSAPSYDIPIYEEFLTWLKTLKDRFGCEANCTTTKELKPSEEQTSDNKIKPRFSVDDVMRTHQEVDNNITDGLPVVVSIDDTYYHCTNELIAIKNQDDYEYPPMNRMKKPIDKVEPKFYEREWLTENHPNDYARFVQILEIVEVQGKNRYRISRDLHNDEDIVECRFIEDNWHPFNIQDAKDGDLIYVSTEEKGIQAIFHEYKNETIFFHCYLCGDFGLGGYMPIGDVKLVYPLQKNHYKSFFAKMKEAGCKWDGQSKRMLRNDIGL